MKKFYSTILALGIITAGFGQHAIETNGYPVSNLPSKSRMDSRATGSYYIDYEGYDGSFSSLGSSVAFYNVKNPVYFNPAAATPLGMGDAYVVFDTMIVTQDYTVFDFFPINSVQNLTVDTLFARFHHQNSSTTTDSIILQIRNVTSTGLPGTTVIWDTILTSNVSLTGLFTGTGYPIATLAVPVGITVPSKKFTYCIQYRGAAVDTFGIISSAQETGATCATGGNEEAPSEVNPNSFYRFWNTGVLGSINPNASGVGGLFADCDGDGPGGLPADWPTEQAFKSYSMWASITITDNMSIEDETEFAANVYPNPASNQFTIDFNLTTSSDVVVNLTDITGKVVYSNNLGNKPAGKNSVVVNTEDLNNGIYMYTVNANGKKITRRIVINK